MLKLAVRRGQANTIVRAKHSAGFKPVTELDRLAREIERHADLLRHLHQSRLGIRILQNAHRRHAGLKDAGFFRRDVPERGPELCHVIAADAGDRRHFGLDYVGAVQPSAQTGLDDCQFHFLIREIFECDGGQHIEIRRRRTRPRDQRHDRLHRTRKIRL